MNPEAWNEAREN